MNEQNLNFDEIIDRKGTSSLKYDFAKRRGLPEDVLPLWVADMDFKTSSIILDKLKERVEHGIFGYTDTKEEYFAIVSEWFWKKHNYEVKEEWLIKTPGIVVALALAVKAYTEVGESVLIQQPVYYPFTEVISDNGRTVISSDLYLGEDNKYHIDFKDFEEKIVENNVKLFFLCNPHNPVGRVWTKEELIKLGDICIKHGVVVVSDEIHQDFVFCEHEHVVFPTIKPEFAMNSIVCTSPGKTFNLAGLQISNIFIENEVLRKKFKKQLSGIGYSQLGTMGITACEAAYQYGEEWFEAVHCYIKENIKYTQKYIEEQIPQLSMIDIEGTYLVWIDFRRLNLSLTEQKNLIVNKAKLWLDSGAVFGEVGKGFERINVACPRRILTEALDRIKAAIDQL